jgi:hypothetical protein
VLARVGQRHLRGRQRSRHRACHRGCHRSRHRRQRRHRAFGRGVAAARPAWGAARRRRTAAATAAVTMTTTGCQSKDRERQREQQIAKAHGGGFLSSWGCTATKGSHAAVLEDRRTAGQTTRGRMAGGVRVRAGEHSGEADLCGAPSQRRLQFIIDSMRLTKREATTLPRHRRHFPCSHEKGCERRQGKQAGGSRRETQTRPNCGQKGRLTRCGRRKRQLPDERDRDRDDRRKRDRNPQWVPASERIALNDRYKWDTARRARIPPSPAPGPPAPPLGPQARHRHSKVARS